MISVFEAISVLEMPSSVFCNAMAKTTSGKPSKMATAAETATGTEMTTATAEMPATEMAAATTEASTMPATEASTSSAMAAAVSECGGGRNRQNTGQNQTGKETVK
jgi:hypothetical protein